MLGGNDCKCDVKNWLITGLIVAVLALGLDMFFHHYCMMKVYEANMSLFRPMEQMMQLRWYGYAGYVAFGLLFTCIYSKGYDATKGKAGQGIRYGILMGLFYWGAGLLIAVPVMPWSKQLVIDWFAIGVAEFAILGFIVGMLYKPKMG
ncbi:MAG: hypothetical protein Q7T03_07540 [Deltaproteobacteria bacterium]|nr:hypothetical protein [Deltaproteobacteria bacterium]